MGRQKESIAVIGEGVTEKYFVLSLRDVLIKKPSPVMPKNSSLSELDITIKECIKKGYDRIYCLIDLDNKVPDGNPEHERNAQEYGKLKRLYHNKSHRGCAGNKSLVIMIESFPATETFLMYYFGYTNAIYTNHKLKKILFDKVGYLTEEKYLIKHSLHDVLTSFGGSLESAVKASGQSSLTRLQHEDHCFSEIGQMIEYLQCPK